jgi:methylphosphotriester-DNA--protein-cysteine methyltransferase
MLKKMLLTMMLVGVVLVGSAKSNKYHFQQCQWAQRISAQNLVTFKDSRAARAMGYVPCKVCRPQ